VNAIQKLLSGLKNVLQKPQEAFQGFWQWIYQAFMQNLMQTCSLIFPSIADRMKHEVEKELVKNNACSERGVMWQSDAIGFQKCDLGLSSHLLSPRQLQQ
jgi:hypothetical protein